MGMFWRVSKPEQLEARLKNLSEWLLENWDWTHECKLVPQVLREPRTLSQNALMHVWFKDISTYFTERNYPLTPEQAKDLMKYRFLGTEDRVIGQTVIKDQLRHTRDLSKGEETQFLSQIQEWAQDKGLTLTCRADCEYMKLMEAQRQ